MRAKYYYDPSLFLFSLWNGSTALISRSNSVYYRPSPNSISLLGVSHAFYSIGPFVENFIVTDANAQDLCELSRSNNSLGPAYRDNHTRRIRSVDYRFVYVNMDCMSHMTLPAFINDDLSLMRSRASSESRPYHNSWPLSRQRRWQYTWLEVDINARWLRS